MELGLPEPLASHTQSEELGGHFLSRQEAASGAGLPTEENLDHESQAPAGRESEMGCRNQRPSPASSKQTAPQEAQEGSGGDVQAVVLNTAALPVAKAQREPARETIPSALGRRQWDHCPTLYGGALSQKQKPGLARSSAVECLHVVS